MTEEAVSYLMLLLHDQGIEKNTFEIEIWLDQTARRYQGQGQTLSWDDIARKVRKGHKPITEKFYNHFQPIPV